MNTLKKNWLIILSLFAGGVLTILPGIASANTLCTPVNTVMNVVAHADDTMLFQNPSTQHEINSGKCVIMVFTSASDAGHYTASYVYERENGVKASAAFMAGVATNSPWTLTDAGVSGHNIARYTLDTAPKISLVFLRLPDGGIDGNGFSSQGNKSLKQLWNGDISSITSNDGANSYNKQGLTDALLALMNIVKPSRINTQDFIGSFSDGDHSDHHATAFFVKSAHNNYATLHTIYSYQDYETASMPINIFDQDLLTNQNTFFTYTPFDKDACKDLVSCTGYYSDWLKREYINGSEQGGDLCANIEGNQLSIPEGDQLVNGQCVPLFLSCEQTILNTSFVSDVTNSVSTGGFAVATFVPSTWTANIPGATWIWNAFHVADPVNGEILTFTKDFTITGTPTVGSITIASDDNYRATMNGSEFANISDINNFTSGNEDIYDVTSQLHSGINTLTITVSNIATGDVNPEDNPAGLLYKINLVQNSCTSAPTDICPNIEGVQGSVPEGYQLVEGQCTVLISPTLGGGSTIFDYWGCTNKNATNFNSIASKDDGSCKIPQGGSSSSTDVGGSNVGEVLGASTTTPDLSLPIGCTEYIHSYMRQGRKNDSEDVSRLQTFLNETMGAKIPVTGIFGSMTRSWVKKFQVAYHGEIIKPWYDAGYKGKDIENGSGYVYKTTKREINMIKCASLNLPLPNLAPDLGR